MILAIKGWPILVLSDHKSDNEEGVSCLQKSIKRQVGMIRVWKYVRL